LKRISYIFTRMSNFDTYLERLKKRDVSQATLTLLSYEVIVRDRVKTVLLARIEFKNKKKEYTFEKKCGSFLITYSEKKKKTQFNKANNKLVRMIDQISSHDIEVNNQKLRFEYNPNAEKGISYYKNPYERFSRTDLILRDQLAIDRTILANERTFFSYARASLALILTGAGFIKFFETFTWWFLGSFLIGLGLTVIMIGIWRTTIMSRKIRTTSKTFKTEQYVKQEETPHEEDES